MGCSFTVGMVGVIRVFRVIGLFRLFGVFGKLYISILFGMVGTLSVRFLLYRCHSDAARCVPTMFCPCLLADFRFLKTLPVSLYR